MNIKILGSGCTNCEKLVQIAREAVALCEIDAEIEKVSDIADIMALGVMTTPALVVDGEVKVAGRVPSVGDVQKILQRAAQSPGD